MRQILPVPQQGAADELHWLRPGSVWAIDFAHPPHRIDNCFPAIASVRDLASRQQLLWLPVSNETADTTIDALLDLFDEHGAPLVLKCDNGPAFVAQATKEFLRDRSVVTLYSPPYAPWYNGAIERELDLEALLPHYLETEIVRLALQPVLESLCYLHVTRRRITPPINRRKSARIT